MSVLNRRIGEAPSANRGGGRFGELARVEDGESAPMGRATPEGTENSCASRGATLTTCCPEASNDSSSDAEELLFSSE